MQCPYLSICVHLLDWMSPFWIFTISKFTSLFWRLPMPMTANVYLINVHREYFIHQRQVQRRVPRTVIVEFGNHQLILWFPWSTTMTLRQRFSKDPLKVVRQLDAFPKVPEEYQQSTRIGGTRKQNKHIHPLLLGISWGHCNFSMEFTMIFQIDFIFQCQLSAESWSSISFLKKRCTTWIANWYSSSNQMLIWTRSWKSISTLRLPHHAQVSIHLQQFLYFLSINSL